MSPTGPNRVRRRARHQTVIGGDHQGGAARQHRQQVGNHPVDGSQLGVVVLAEAELVGDLVDAVVVGVDEQFARSDRSPDLDRQRRRGPPSLLTAAGLVGPSEAGGRKRGVLHHDRALTTKRRVRLKLLGNDALSCIAVLVLHDRTFITSLSTAAR